MLQNGSRLGFELAHSTYHRAVLALDNMCDIPHTRAVITARLDLISLGHFGNHKRFEGLIELKWLNGNRVYTFMWGTAVVVALYGGNKNGQNRDIKKAKKIRDEVLEGSRTLHK